MTASVFILGGCTRLVHHYLLFEIKKSSYENDRGLEFIPIICKSSKEVLIYFPFSEDILIENGKV